MVRNTKKTPNDKKRLFPDDFYVDPNKPGDVPFIALLHFLHTRNSEENDSFAVNLLAYCSHIMSEVHRHGKYDGEKEVERELDKFFIVRISWAFGVNGKNFVRTMLNLSKTKDTLSVVYTVFICLYYVNQQPCQIKSIWRVNKLKLQERIFL